MKRDGWTQLGKGINGKWMHNATGWLVRHCGHPTAIWPWYAVSPAGDMMVAPNGHGFRLLGIALDAVELRIGGEVQRDLFDLLDAG